MPLTWQAIRATLRSGASVRYVQPFVLEYLHAPGKYVDGADHVGVFLVLAGQASKVFLLLTIACVDVTAGGTGLAGVLRCDGDDSAALPLQLVFQLAPELEPALVEGCWPCSGSLGSHVLARMFSGTRCECRHVSHRPVLDAHHSVVLPDGSRGLVQEVAPHVGYCGMDLLDPGSGLSPVAAVTGLSAQGLLRPAQRRFVPPEAVERCEERAALLITH
jgi:hypothetical protein